MAARATSEMAAATSMPTASSTVATATTCERGGGHDRQNAGQNQTSK
jgi:hypothetical protein